MTDILLTERQSVGDDHLSTSLRFFNLPLEIGPKWQRTVIIVGHLEHYYFLAVPGIKPRSSAFPRQVFYPLGHSGRYHSASQYVALYNRKTYISNHINMIIKTFINCRIDGFMP